MTSRTSVRAPPPTNNRVELPSLSHPQYIDDNDYELEEEAWLARQNTAEVVGDDNGLEPGESALNEEAQTLDISRAEEQEELYSAADSLVLPLSLNQTRTHHLDHLLPLIFSHPPVPSYNRPRIRTVQKPGLTFPTPPPPALPLPSKEYHGLLQPKELNTPATPTGGDKASMTAHAAKAAKAAARAAEKDADTPAHEIDCIARVTLTVGPISFPGTELWVGRFVEPKATLPKRPKQLVKGEKREKRTSLGEASAAKRARPAASSTAQGPPMPPAPGVIPRNPTSQAARPPAGAAPARNTISPDLIQRVNQAATQHPWLSVIIHKAARGQANKEELAKLGRVVARLTKGEGVGEGPDEGLTTPIAGPSTTFAPAGLRTSAAGPSNTAHSTATEPDSDSDDEVDVSGRPQVGGGPVGMTQDAPVSVDTSDAMPAQVLPTTAPLASAGGAEPPQLGSKNVKSPDKVVTTDTPVGTPTPVAPQGVNPLLPRPTPPVAAPAPRLTYPLPPPFLLVAFKENPTEKFLLPLGSLSYISRVGGDFVTTPKPPPPVDPAPKAQNMTSSPAIAAAPATVVTPTALEGSVPKRTRASMGRAAKTEQPPVPTAPKTPVPPTPEPEVQPVLEEVPVLPKRDLPALPGMPPAPGTVLMSTFIPSTSWTKPDWTLLERHLPFNNPELHDKPIVAPSIPKTEVPDLPSTQQSTTDKPAAASSPFTTAGPPRSPATSRSSRHPKAAPDRKPSSPPKARLLNLGARDFLPHDGPLQPITIRLSEVEDRVWWRMKSVMNAVDFWEQRHLADDEPDLQSDVPGPTPDPQTTSVPPVLRFDPSKHARLREVLGERKRRRFEALVSRVPPRRFLRTRLPDVPKDIIDASTDRWAPRPYPISTKPLYTRSPPPEDEEVPVRLPSPDMSKKRKRGEAEEEVMFEMPVSLDQLDERVEEGAMRGMPGRKRGGAVKKVNKRGEAGRTCEGCARNDVKVWRRGPGGRGTLCQVCGDKFTSGTLGELKAPGAAKKQAEQEGDETVKIEDSGDIAVAEGANGVTTDKLEVGGDDVAELTPAQNVSAQVSEPISTRHGETAETELKSAPLDDAGTKTKTGTIPVAVSISEAVPASDPEEAPIRDPEAVPPGDPEEAPARDPETLPASDTITATRNDVVQTKEQGAAAGIAETTVDASDSPAITDEPQVTQE
ncbi:hypothetical protein BCR39DRAFT_518739 [Naematelia encephala]|uniref:GATA-type domain-containing protein n=1 Tax=Naematelia encephala TaxID=71784 RepID=A0A1Y2BFX9_9TREE|nr:hypothetical protein BCR39DRAFT_518739 [Naematelia encephala]